MYCICLVVILHSKASLPEYVSGLLVCVALHYIHSVFMYVLSSTHCCFSRYYLCFFFNSNYEAKSFNDSISAVRIIVTAAKCTFAVQPLFRTLRKRMYNNRKATNNKLLPGTKASSSQTVHRCESNERKTEQQKTQREQQEFDSMQLARENTVENKTSTSWKSSEC